MKIFPFRVASSAFSKKGKDRKNSVRFSPAPSEARVSAARVGIAALTVGVVLALYLPLGTSQVFVPAEGVIVKEDILAPFDFHVLKPEEEYRREQAEEAAKELPVARVGDETTREMELRVRDFFLAVERVIDTEGEAEDQHRMISELGVPLTESARNVLLDMACENRLRLETVSFFQDVLDQGILADKSVFTDQGYDRITLQRDGEEYTLGLDNFVDVDELSNLATERGREVFGENRALLTTFYEVVTHFAGPNLFYDVRETEVRRQTRREAVLPHTELYLEGQKIIGAHERVTRNHVMVLRSLEKKWAEERIETVPWQRIYPHLGRLLASLTVVTLFLAFLRRHRRNIFARDKLLLLLSTIGLIGIGLSALFGALGLSPYLMPVVLVGMLATLLFDDHVGIALTGAWVLTISLVEGLQLPLIFTLGTAGATAVYGVAGVRERSGFWRSLLYVGAAYVIAIGASDFLHLTPNLETLRKIGFGLLSAFGSAGVAMILLPLFEPLFGVTTNITLLELSDLNRPILKTLSLRAPGTYHHSLMVGNLAESAAERIRANSLLARVGAYYHDIGKMTKPEYFVENQVGRENKHDRLSPKLSALVLISHVREGMEMARKERLPAEIQDAIREHHGTTLMAFFYDKASQAAPDAEVPEGEFRYPGPKPRTKENGIIMLADVSEASTRALVDPTPGRIRQRIIEVTNAKFAEGQLDDCDLTFRELRLIQESFVPILTSSMHSRIRYPDEVRREEDRFAVGGLLGKSPEKR
ncbi:MAG: HDIG domain-containing metalloprotein [Candidatus Eisenbacteria bacterium]